MPEELNPHPTAPVIVLASGQSLKMEQVFLYETIRINEIASLKATAAQAMGGVHTGIGFWGSPSWAISGAAALGLVEGILSSAARKRAAEILNSCQDKYREMLRRGVFFNAAQISNLTMPHPSAWIVFGSAGNYSHDGDEFVHIGTSGATLAVRWSTVSGYFPPQQSAAAPGHRAGSAPGGWPTTRQGEHRLMGERR